MVLSTRKQAMGTNWNKKMFYLHINNHFITALVTKQWCREPVGTLLEAVFKSRMNIVLVPLTWVFLLEPRVVLDVYSSSCQPQSDCDSQVLIAQNSQGVLGSRV